MSCLTYWLWIIYEIHLSSVQPVFSYVTWEVETSIIRIGGTVVLTCTVHDIKVIDPEETRQWFKGSSLVCYNGKPTNPWKYMESLNRNTFLLHIYNVTEADLNCKYECLYSFETYSKRLKITAENFENPPTAATTDLQYNYTRINRYLHVELRMNKIFPLPNCTVSLEALQLKFAECTYKKNGLYFDVHLVHKSGILLEASTQFNVTCKLLQEYFIDDRLISVPKDENPIITSDERSKLNIAPIVLIPLILVYLTIIVVTVVVNCKARRRKKKSKPKDENVIGMEETPGRTKDENNLITEAESLMTKTSEKVQEKISQEMITEVSREEYVSDC